VSVLLATRDRSELLRQTLDHLARQQAGALRWEIIVVDNGSTDRTPEVLADARSKLPLTTIHEPLSGKSRAVNRALDAARGELLILTDDDVIADPGWLGELHAASERWPRGALLGGRIEPRFPPGTPAWLERHPFAVTAFARYEPANGEGVVRCTPFGPNLALRRSTIGDVRFNESIGPNGRTYPMGCETELLRRLADRGAISVYVPSARVQHVVRPEQVRPAWLALRAFNFGRGHARELPDPPGPWLLGAPRYLWRQVAEAWLATLAGALRDEAERFSRRVRLHWLRGILHEYRIMTRDASATRSQPPPSARA